MYKRDSYILSRLSSFQFSKYSLRNIIIIIIIIINWHCSVGLIASCLFVVYLTTFFKYLRLYSVDFYSILIRLPSSSEAGETRVRNMVAEFCRRAPIVLVGFFNMP
jgi:hypothetical protein